MFPPLPSARFFGLETLAPRGGNQGDKVTYYRGTLFRTDCECQPSDGWIVYDCQIINQCHLHMGDRIRHYRDAGFNSY
jgi:hypothetical protein